MKEPRRLLAVGETSSVSRSLLEAGRARRDPEGARNRVWGGLGVAVATGAATATASGLASSASVGVGASAGAASGAGAAVTKGASIALVMTKAKLVVPG